MHPIKAIIALLVLLFFLPSAIPAQAPADDELNQAIPPAVKHGRQIKDQPQNPDSVRIDDTGVHVGGPDPVDINIPNHWHSNKTALIPLVAIISVFGMPVALLALLLYFRHRRTRMMHETMRAMLEKGVPIPPELFADGKTSLNIPSVSARNDLRNGLILIGAGVSIIILAGKIGLIPLFIGVAMLIAWLIMTLLRRNQVPS
jgi:hypothetical protein